MPGAYLLWREQQGRAHSEVTEPIRVTSPEPVQETKNRMQAAFLWGLLNTPQVPKTNQELFEPPHPKSNCLFLSSCKPLRQYRLIANNTEKEEKKFLPPEERLTGAHREL